MLNPEAPKSKWDRFLISQSKPYVAYEKTAKRDEKRDVPAEVFPSQVAYNLLFERARRQLTLAYIADYRREKGRQVAPVTFYNPLDRAVSAPTPQYSGDRSVVEAISHSFQR